MNARTQVSTRPPNLRDLGTLVTVQYPDRPDLALIAALRLLTIAGAPAEYRAVEIRGALLTRRARNAVRQAAPLSLLDPARSTPDHGVLLVGLLEPAVVIVGPDSLLDITSTYELAQLDLPDRLLLGPHAPSPAARDHLLVDFPFGVTGVYRTDRADSPFAAAYRLMSRLGPLNRRRIDHDLTQLEAMWRQLRDTA